MKILLLIFIAFLNVFQVAFSQSQYYRSYLNVSNSGFSKIHPTSDGGFIVGTAETGVIKFDPCGNKQWERTIPGFQSSDFIVSSDGNYIFASNADNSIKLLKMDTSGNVIWSKQYTSSIGNYRFMVYCISEFTNGDLSVNGILESQMNGPYYNFIVKTNSSGDVKWGNWYNQFPAWGLSIACSDGGVLARIANLSYKTDSLGNLAWSKAYFGTSYAFKPVEVPGGFVYANYGETGAQDTGFVYKIDYNGNILWAGERFNVNFLTEIQRLPNGNFLVLGSLKPTTDYNFLPTTIEVDSIGGFISQRVYVPTDLDANSWHGDGFDILDDGSMVIAGKERMNIGTSQTTSLYIIKTNKQRELGCGDSIRSVYYPAKALRDTIYSGSTNSLGLITNALNYSSQVSSFTDSLFCSNYTPYLLNLGMDTSLCNTSLTLHAPEWLNQHLWSTGETGTSITINTPGLYWLKSIDPCSGDTLKDTIQIMACITSINEHIKPSPVIIHPNPFNDEALVKFPFSIGQTNLTIKIVDVTGHQVKRIDNIRSNEIKISKEAILPGIYFINIIDNGIVIAAGKIIIQ